MRHLIFTTLFVFITAVTFAGPNGRFVYHTVEKGETLYSISHMYGLKPQDLAQFNEAIGDKLTIHVGQKIKIPSTDAATETEIVADNAPQPVATEQYHVVVKGETVFSISKMYSISKNDLMAWNKIKDNSISVGQKLIVKNEGNAAILPADKPHAAPAAHSSEPAVAKADVQKAMKKEGYTWTMPAETAKNTKSNVSTATGDATASSTPVGLADTKVIKSWKAETTGDVRDYYQSKSNSYDPATEYQSLYYQNIYSGMNKKTETGVAKFLADNNTANTAYYNNAPIGTILKLTNADNGKSTYAIVVGKIPPTEENSYLMKLSGKVARNLAAKDYTSIEIVCYTEN
jgi:peptidoglycan endopeptidase LytF